MATFYRISAAPMTSSDCHRNHLSKLWATHSVGCKDYGQNEANLAELLELIEDAKDEWEIGDLAWICNRLREEMGSSAIERNFLDAVEALEEDEDIDEDDRDADASDFWDDECIDDRIVSLSINAPREGMSCFEDIDELRQYASDHMDICGDYLVAFEGEAAGSGHDGEDLAHPVRIISNVQVDSVDDIRCGRNA